MANRQGDVDLRFAQVSAPVNSLPLASLGSAKESVIHSLNIGIQQEDTSTRKHQESRYNIKKRQYVLFTLRRTAGPYQEV